GGGRARRPVPARGPPPAPPPRWWRRRCRGRRPASRRGPARRSRDSGASAFRAARTPLAAPFLADLLGMLAGLRLLLLARVRRLVLDRQIAERRIEAERSQSRG